MTNKQQESGSGAPEQGDENKLIAERRGKLAALRARGGPAFPNDFRRTALAGQLQSGYGEQTGEWLDANPTRVSVGGRMMLKRTMGKVSFANIADRTGQIHLFLQKDAAGAEAYEDFKSWDVGDIVG